MLGKHPTTLKNHIHERRRFQERLWLIGVVMATLIALLLFRLGYLQLFSRARYTTLSKQNLLTVLPIAPNRGLIFARDGSLLAKNITAYSLAITPDRAKNLTNTIEQLKKLLPISDNDIKNFQRLRKQRRRFEPVPLRMKLTEKEVAKVYVNRYQLPGVSIEAHLIRNYPQGKTFSHVLGYVGRLNAYEAQHVDETNYSATNYIGKVGIEKHYEDRLHGQVGYQKVETDASGRIVRVLDRDPPKSGDNLTLTLDPGLQAAAQRALAGKSGAIVALDPNNGQVLALVSTPTFDPNPFSSGIAPKNFAKLQQSQQQPLFNRAIRGQYPPASTIKVFLALGSLALHMNDPHREIFDRGWFQLENSKHHYRDWKHEGHGWVNLRMAIIQSCDTYFYDLAHRMTIDNIAQIARRFGLGKPTGIDLNEELPGLVPDRAWKKRTHGQSWYPGDTLISGIGQGYFLATPLQLAVATATLASHGHRFQPTLLLKRTTPSQEAIITQPQPAGFIDLLPKTWNTIIEAMRDVIQSPGGTGFRFGRHAPYSVAAKTGTAQVFSKGQHGDVQKHAERLPFKLRDHGLFIAFAPIEKPKIALAILVEHDPQSASVIARKVLDYYLVVEKHENL